MKQPVTIGAVCLARKTFDYNAAAGIYAETRRALEKITNIEWQFVDDLVIEVDDARAAAARLSKMELDGLVCISGTFHLGHLVLELARTIKAPLLLWGLNELPYDGGKIRLNSVCGVNLDASNLYKAGIRNYHAIIRDTIDEDWIDAVRIAKALSTARVGIAGYRAHGFFNIDIDEPSTYRETGALVDHFELQDLYNHHVEKSAIKEEKEKYLETFDVSGISAEQLESVATLSARMRAFLDAGGISALAIRCWPEFASSYGIAPCAAMSLLQSEGRILACEGDIDGALSMLAHRAAGAQTPFLADLSQVNMDENFALLWHCGAAPCGLWDGICVRSLDTYFAGGKGVTADFVMKPGVVSIMRLDSVGGRYRVFQQNALGIQMEKELRGTYLKAVFEEPVKSVFNRIIFNGIAHHASVSYGDFRRPVEIFARIKGWEIIS